MQKQLLKLSIVILSVIILTGTVLYIKNDSKVDFPHYKQAFYGIEGSLYVMQDTIFDLPLVFVDSYEMSEMSSSENIKSIKIMDKELKELNIQRWTVQDKTKGDEYIFRNIQLEVLIKDVGSYKPETLIIIFQDNYEKQYNFGDFVIHCHDSGYYDDHQYVGVNMQIDHVQSSRNVDKFHLNALSVYLSPYFEGLTVKDIDLGINSFGIDVDNVKVEQMKYDLNTVSNYIEDRLLVNDEWAKNASSIKVVGTIQELKDKEITPFYIKEITPERDEGTLVILPLKRVSSTNLNQIKIFNITLFVEVNGEEKVVIDFYPYYAMPFLFDESTILEYLWEAGL